MTAPAPSPRSSPYDLVGCSHLMGYDAAATRPCAGEVQCRRIPLLGVAPWTQRRGAKIAGAVSDTRRISLLEEDEESAFN
jgi:hypothetical protein